MRHALATDSESSQMLEDMVGTSALLLVEDTDICLRFDVVAGNGNSIKVRWAIAAEDTDVSLELPVAAAVNWLYCVQELPPGAKVRGSVEMLDKWRALRSNYKPDMEQWLADRLGDDIARIATQGAHLLLAANAAVRNKLRRDIPDALQHSRRGVASPMEIDKFIRRVDGLRTRLEWLRVQARTAAENNR
ncbi:MAG: hypothetical protein ACNYPG_00270 [Candidatus Porifericomitaceae bacterium WSBS_2022_MAG_OTU9]